jgi:hypothetical protein
MGVRRMGSFDTPRTPDSVKPSTLTILSSPMI